MVGVRHVIRNAAAMVVEVRAIIDQEIEVNVGSGSMLYTWLN